VATKFWRFALYPTVLRSWEYGTVILTGPPNAENLLVKHPNQVLSHEWRFLVQAVIVPPIKKLVRQFMRVGLYQM
jgi:hypothetical protein